MKGYMYNKKYIYLSIVLLAVLWIILSRAVGNQIIIPSPGKTLASLIEIIKDPNFKYYVSQTLSRSFLSFLISILLALILGVLAGLNRFIYNMMIPVTSILKSVPVIAIIVLTLIWMDSERAPVLIGIIVVFPILYDSVVEAMLNVDSKLIEMANLFSVRLKNIIKDIYIPTIYNYLSPVIGAALGLTMKTVIAGEVLGQPRYSIGGSLQLEKLYLNTAGVFAWIIIIVLMATIIEHLVKLFFRVNK